jgi:hypothetical protein
LKRKKETHIRFEYLPYEHAKKAYADGYFVEAIQVLHACIERQLRELLFLHRSKPEPHENFDLAYDSMLEIPFNIAVKVLFIQKVISGKERDRLLALNKMRNSLTHKMYFDKANGSWHGNPKTQYDKTFKDALKLIIQMEDKVCTFDFKK